MFRQLSAICCQLYFFQSCPQLLFLIVSFNNCSIIIIIIINDIYRVQNLQMQQMRQVSCCMITVVLELVFHLYEVIIKNVQSWNGQIVYQLYHKLLYCHQL